MHDAAGLARWPSRSEITLMPRCIAFLPTGTSALASLAETMMPSTFWAIRRVDDGDLVFRRGLGRRGVDDLDAAEFLGGLHGAVAAGVEIGVAEVLHHHGDALVGGEGGAQAGERQRRAGGEVLEDVRRLWPKSRRSSSVLPGRGLRPGHEHQRPCPAPRAIDNRSRIGQTMVS